MTTTSKQVTDKIVELRRSGIKNSPTVDKAIGVLEKMRDAFVTIERIERYSSRRGFESLH
jgi:hypothetical protein